MTWREIFVETDLAMSRTSRGVSDTSASSRKHPLLLDGEALREASQRNRDRLLDLLEDLPAPESARAAAEGLARIEATVNAGLLPEGRFRTWELDYPEGNIAAHVLVRDLPAEMERLAEELHARWPGDPVATAAFVEWTLNGPLHPYYDGCGRISRGAGAWVLLRAGLLPPLYSSKSEWYEAAAGGLDAFTAFVRRSVERAGAC